MRKRVLQWHRFCVATPSLWLPSETFVRRHIAEIAPERTAVLFGSEENAERLKMPHFRWTPPRPASRSRILRFVIGRWNLWRRGATTPLARRHHRAVVKFLKRNDVSRVLAEYGPTGSLLVEACRDANVQLSVHFHGWDASYSLQSKFCRCEYRKMAEYAEHLITPSQFLADRLAEIGLPREKLHVVPCGVDTTVFSPSSTRDPQLLLAVGRLVPKKAPHLTIEAFSRVASKHPQARLEIIGDGLLRPECERRVRQYGLSDRVVLHGSQNHEFVRERLKQASIFVQHSVTANGNTEGLPVSILEAMACGVPVVSTYHSGIPEAVLDKECGFLVPEGDVGGMAIAMDRLLANPEQRDSFGKTARQRAESLFSAKGQIRELRRLFALEPATKHRALSAA